MKSPVNVGLIRSQFISATEHNGSRIPLWSANAISRDLVPVEPAL